ncbi:MAG: glycosyltransferase [Rickettsiales bacterium]|jgi:glycosyltransferase involved in cell wall biosynthesis|nr:glycosyltransferase [Rickettsiales bacterium]
MNPKISIILPIYNGGKYLKPALESVLNQTFKDWECICVNDGSTDNSAAIAGSFASGDARFVFIDSDKNRGVSCARNAGLDAARGEYVTFLDQDDLIAPDAFAMYMDLAGKYNADMVRGRYEMVKDDFKIPVAPLYDGDPGHTPYGDPKSDFPMVASKRGYGIWVFIWTCCFRKDAIRDIRFNRELVAGGEDNLFIAEVVEKIKNFVQSDAVVVFHRESDISTTLCGFNKNLVQRFAVTTPYLHEHFKNRDDIWANFIMGKEASGMYCVIKRVVKENMHLEPARRVLKKLSDSGMLGMRFLNWKRRMFLNLFINGRIRLVRFLMQFA